MLSWFYWKFTFSCLTNNYHETTKLNHIIHIQEQILSDLHVSSFQTQTRGRNLRGNSILNVSILVFKSVIWITNVSHKKNEKNTFMNANIFHQIQSHNMCIKSLIFLITNFNFYVSISEFLQRLVSCSMGHLKIQINKQYLLRWKLYLRDNATKSSWKERSGLWWWW